MHVYKPVPELMCFRSKQDKDFLLICTLCSEWESAKSMYGCLALHITEGLLQEKQIHQESVVMRTAFTVYFFLVFV